MSHPVSPTIREQRVGRRPGTLPRETAASALQTFRSEWLDWVQVQATETCIPRADALAWELGLQGYDAIQLVSALLCENGMDEEATPATFSARLREAAGQCGWTPFPSGLPSALSTCAQTAPL